MLIHVLFFGMLKDLAGRDRDSLNLADDATLQDVIAHYQQSIPQLREMAGSIAMSVNQVYAGPEQRLETNDEVALLPPVSGGAPDHLGPENDGQPRAFIVRQKIDTQGLLDAVKQPEDGAAAVFEGVVRNNTRGRRTLYLEYEAY